jgi:capsular exopolysaccharide synthesis family protein
MERIKQALDKARARRQTAARDDAAAEAPRRSKPVDDADGLATEIVIPESVEYSISRRIDLNTKRLAENRVVAGLSGDPRSQLFRMLRTQVLRKMREHDWRTLAITAPTSGAGKSLIAVNLAISIAMEVNQTVLLVDLDLRSPTIHQYFDFQPEQGIQDYFESDVPLSQIMVNPGLDRLVLLPGRGSIENSSEIVSSPKMITLADELRRRYASRYVIYDLPPLLVIDDAIAFMPNVDCSLFVVEKGRNTEDEVKKSLRLLQGTHMVGAVLNKVRIKENTNYYY